MIPPIISNTGSPYQYIDHISALCLRERVHPLSKKIDGAVITSKAENNLDCTITFQTDTILQKFMLRFEKLALDCNDHLYIYDGAHTIGNHKVGFMMKHSSNSKHFFFCSSR